MNVVREIQRINQQELDIAINNPNASWHQQYKDSAYIFIGGLPYDLTEGDVVTIFSQYGEVIDVNLPRASTAQPPPGSSSSSGAGRDQQRQEQQHQQQQQGKGKHRGFGFLMYEDQRSTVLAVDNLNGASILGRTIRVDHVANYKHKGERDEEGNYHEPEQPSMNAAPQMVAAGSIGATAAVGGQDDGDADEDLEDPMVAYFRSKKKAGKLRSREHEQGGDDDVDTERRGAKSSSREEKMRRKEERARIRAQRAERKAKGGSTSRHGHERDMDESRRRRGGRQEPVRRDEGG